MMFAFIGMWKFAIAGSLLSLGALDFGLVVDSSVVLVEHCVSRLSQENGKRSKRDVIRDAAIEVRKPTLLGELIILIVYVPILTLEGVEGKLFPADGPDGHLRSARLAYPVDDAYSCACEPVPSASAGGKGATRRAGHSGTRRTCAVLAMKFRWATLGLSLAAVLAAGMLLHGYDAQFVPTPLRRGGGLERQRLPGTDIQEVVRLNSLMESHLLKEFPNEIDYVWCRCGRRRGGHRSDGGGRKPTSSLH